MPRTGSATWLCPSPRRRTALSGSRNRTLLNAARQGWGGAVSRLYRRLVAGFRGSSCRKHSLAFRTWSVSFGQHFPCPNHLSTGWELLCKALCSPPSFTPTPGSLWFPVASALAPASGPCSWPARRGSCRWDSVCVGRGVHRAQVSYNRAGTERQRPAPRTHTVPCALYYSCRSLLKNKQTNQKTENL